MKILNYILSLLPRLEKSQMLEDLRITKTEIEKNVVPTYEAAIPHFKTNKFKSQDVTGLAEMFYRNYELAKSNKQANFIVEIASRLKSLLTNIDAVTDQIEDTLDKDVINEGLTARKALLIRAAEQMGAISGYATDLLVFVYYNEALAYGADKSNDSIALPKMTEDRVRKNIVQFARMLSVYGRDPKDFAASLANLPDVVLNSKTAVSLTAVYREERLDPFSGTLAAGFTGNPIYHLRLVVAEWQSNRYKNNKDKKRMLELRLLYLKTLVDGTPDAQLEREIQYIQGRIEKIEYMMAKAEE